MAIVNRTPDSLLRPRRRTASPTAPPKMPCTRLVAEGADVIDIGGVKAGFEAPTSTPTRRPPGWCPSSKWVRAAYPQQCISVDTWRASVAKLACAAGADIINDTWAGADPQLPEVAAGVRRRTGLLAHRRGGPANPALRVNYGTSLTGVVDDVIAGVTRRRARCRGRCPARRHPDRPHPRLRQEHLSRPGPAAARARSGRDRMAGADGAEQQGLHRETLGVELTERLEGTLAATALAAADGARMFGSTRSDPPVRVLEMVASHHGGTAAGPNRAGAGMTEKTSAATWTGAANLESADLDGPGTDVCQRAGARSPSCCRLSTVGPSARSWRL